MQFKELQDLTYHNIQELAREVDVNLTTIKKYLNRAERQFVRETRCKQLTIDITTVADQVSYTSSDAANLAYVYDVDWARYIDETERGTKLKVMNHGDLPERYQYGNPYWFWVQKASSGYEIGTHPIISESSKTLRVRAFIYPVSAMSVDADEPNFEDAWQDALPEWAAYKLFNIYSHKNPAFGRRSQDHYALYRSFVDDYNGNNIKGFTEFTTVQDVYGD